MNEASCGLPPEGNSRPPRCYPDRPVELACSHSCFNDATLFFHTPSDLAETAVPTSRRVLLGTNCSRSTFYFGFAVNDLNMSGDQCLRLLHDSFVNEKRIFELIVRSSECGDEELEHTIQRLVFLIADPGRRLDVVSYRVTGIPILPQIGEVKPNSVAERQNGVFIEQGLPGEKGEAVALREDGKASECASTSSFGESANDRT